MQIHPFIETIIQIIQSGKRKHYLNYRILLLEIVRPFALMQSLLPELYLEYILGIS